MNRTRLAAAALALTACSSSGAVSGNGATSSGSLVANGGDPSGVAAARAAVQAATTFPKTIPVTEPLPSKPPTGKTVVYLQCEQQECNLEGNGIRAAAAAIGWNYKATVRQREPGRRLGLPNDRAHRTR